MNYRQQMIIMAGGVGVLGVLAAGTLVVGGQTGIDEFGLSDKERETLHLQLKQGEIERQEAFLADFVRQGEDPRKLEQHAYEAERPEPRSSLEESVRDASVIIHGVVTSQRYEIDGTGAIYTISSIEVRESLKGAPSATLEVRQPGGPRIEDGHTHLIISDANPPLFRGDEAVLFMLQLDIGLFLQAYSGQFRVDNGRILALPGNPFAEEVRAEPVAAFKARVKAQVSD